MVERFNGKNQKHNNLAINDELDCCGQSGTAISKIWRSWLFRQLAALIFFSFCSNETRLVQKWYFASSLHNPRYLYCVAILCVIIT